MKKNIILMLGVMGLVSACGTTSELRNASNPSIPLNLSSYQRVIVNDFKDEVSSSKQDPHLVSVGKQFADLLASKLQARHAFKTVERNVKINGPALLIGGDITGYDEGNAALRLMIGFGAGSSVFDAKVVFKDNVTQKEIGQIDVNKMSWLLGGMIASGQDVKDHMHSSADCIADSCAQAVNKL